MKRCWISKILICLAWDIRNFVNSRKISKVGSKQKFYAFYYLHIAAKLKEDRWKKKIKSFSMVFVITKHKMQICNYKVTSLWTEETKKNAIKSSTLNIPLYISSAYQLARKKSYIYLVLNKIEGQKTIWYFYKTYCLFLVFVIRLGSKLTNWK